MKFARPLPRACQIISLVHLLQQLLKHFLSTLALVFKSQQSIQFFWLQFRSPVIFSHQFSAQSTFFCKNLKQCFNCCSNNCFLSVQRAREAASPGASWHWNRVAFESGGAPFFEAVFGTHFFTQKSHILSKIA